MAKILRLILGNHLGERPRMMYRTWDKMDATRKKSILQQAETGIKRINERQNYASA